MKWIISGIPGTGKTFIGDYLRDTKGFRHIDMESGAVFQTLLSSPEDFIRDQLTKSENIVITGGFMTSDLAFSLVNKIISEGYVFIWFDGDRQAARKVFIKRNTVAVDLLDAKMRELEGYYTKIMDLHPIIINTFNTKGEFKMPDLIIEEIHKRLKN
ncbi:MAG: hypothetical protein WC544_00045 [Patescibacteria group bacterium]